MCGRYALGIRATWVRNHLVHHRMPVNEAPEDDETRETYNFAPGYHGLVYRADVPDYGAGYRANGHTGATEDGGGGDESTQAAAVEDGKETRYKLQAMKWGLIPFWTKRNPDYGSVMKTINARDDSLIENRGMWTTMKQRKRCIVVAQGFYEWLKKNGGKEKIPHYVKRKDDQLMCFAGLWDCVQYEGSEDKHYTYTIITTDSNKQLNFLHDRMPVILENGSDQIRTWLDPKRTEWSKELQSLLKPYDGELECYPVSKDVGKVGNNSPAFTIPVASADNKQNIANFFSNGKKLAEKSAHAKPKEPGATSEVAGGKGQDGHEGCKDNQQDEKRITVDEPRSEDNAPMPVPKDEIKALSLKRQYDDCDKDDNDDKAGQSDRKAVKRETMESSQPLPRSPVKSPVKSSEKGKSRTRSAISNGTASKDKKLKSATVDGNKKITAFFQQ